MTITDGKVYIDGAEVTTADVKTKNGVVHVIDKVLLPASVQEEETQGSHDDGLGQSLGGGGSDDDSPFKSETANDVNRKLKENTYNVKYTPSDGTSFRQHFMSKWTTMEMM